MMMAGLDGIEKQIDPGEPLDYDLFEEAAASRRCRARSTRRSTRSRTTTRSCSKGDVFSEDLIETWIDYKRENEVDPSACARTRPSSSCTTTADGRGRQPVC